MNKVKTGGSKVKNSTIIFCSYCFHGFSKPELARMQKKAIKNTLSAHKGVDPILILPSSYLGCNDYIGDSLTKNPGDSFLIIHCSKSNSATLLHKSKLIFYVLNYHKCDKRGAITYF